jgi:hypothetical protein
MECAHHHQRNAFAARPVRKTPTISFMIFDQQFDRQNKGSDCGKEKNE